MRTDIFNMKRFGAYFLSDMRSNIANFGISAAILSAVGLIAYIFCGVIGLTFGGEWVSYPIAGRLITMGVLLVILTISMPVKCYGKLTEKNAGSAFLTLPVSTFEKTASMILSNGIVIPAVVMLVFLGLDALVCACDPGCGVSIASIPFSGYMNDLWNSLEEIPAELSGIRAVMNPLLYMDDITTGILVFTLGALCFKKSKAAKTILVLLALSMAVSMVSTPIMMHIAATGNWDFESAEAMMEKFGWVINHAGLLDTINDTIVNVALSVAIFFRVKTMKF